MPENDTTHTPRFDDPELPPAKQVRSTVLLSSLASARAHGKFDEYLRSIASEHRGAVLALSPGGWVSMAVAEAHYAALDQCGFSNSEMVAIGEETFARLDGTSIGSLFSVFRGLGATPWTGLAICPSLYERTFVGGGIGVFKLGPKDARVEVRGVSLVRYVYFREAWRGIFIGAFKRFSTRMFVHEMPERRTNLRWVLKISWV